MSLHLVDLCGPAAEKTSGLLHLKVKLAIRQPEKMWNWVVLNECDRWLECSWRELQNWSGMPSNILKAVLCHEVDLKLVPGASSEISVQ